MFNDLVLIHRKGGQGALGFTGGFYLPTCLRQVALCGEEQIEFLSTAGAISENDELYRGGEAYRFFLEVICGLRSPLIGETEIFGQFKNAVSILNTAQTPSDLHLRRFLNALNEDAKRIRGEHLKDLGSQSYGSLLRRELKGINEIHILGAGQLVKDMLPWICKDGARVVIHARRIEKARESLRDFSQLMFADLSQAGSLRGVLVVAAPLEASKVNAWVARHGSALERIVDLRGDSDQDLIESPASQIPTLVLKELFERISRNQILLRERKDRALKDITKAVLAREQHVEYRPFGWDDVCA